MNPNIKTQWVKALRSGTYQQGTGRLRPTETTYCCLGVLCDVVDPNSWDLPPVTNTFDAFLHRGFGGAPSTDITEAAGLTTEDVDILAEANDDHGWTFEDIATYIEEML
jgi:hypothetical protein